MPAHYVLFTSVVQLFKGAYLGDMTASSENVGLDSDGQISEVDIEGLDSEEPDTDRWVLPATSKAR